MSGGNVAAADAFMGIFGMRRVECPSEHAEAVMFMRAVRGAEADWPELSRLFHVPNGGARSRKTAADLKAEGVRPGVPDYLLPVRRGGYVGLAIELKRLDGGRTSREQRDWLAHLAAEGWHAVVAHGWEQAFAVVRDYMAADGPESTPAGDLGASGVSTLRGDRSGAQGRAGRNRGGAK